MAEPATVEDAIDREARDAREARDSRQILRALHERREVLGAAAALPAEDRPLTERILQQARSRSAEIRNARGALPHSARMESAGKPIPWWIYALWAAALLAVGLAWYLIG